MQTERFSCQRLRECELSRYGLTAFNEMLTFNYGNRNKGTTSEDEACRHSPLQRGIRSHLGDCEEEENKPIVRCGVIDPGRDGEMEGSQTITNESVSKIVVSLPQATLNC